MKFLKFSSTLLARVVILTLLILGISLSIVKAIRSYARGWEAKEQLARMAKEPTKPRIGLDMCAYTKAYNICMVGTDHTDSDWEKKIVSCDLEARQVGLIDLNKKYACEDPQSYPR